MYVISSLHICGADCRRHILSHLDERCTPLASLIFETAVRSPCGDSRIGSKQEITLMVAIYHITDSLLSGCLPPGTKRAPRSRLRPRSKADGTLRGSSPASLGTSVPPGCSLYIPYALAPIRCPVWTPSPWSASVGADWLTFALPQMTTPAVS